MSEQTGSRYYVLRGISEPKKIQAAVCPYESLGILDKIREAMNSLDVKRLSAPEIGINRQIFCVEYGVEFRQILNPVIEKIHRPYGKSLYIEGTHQHVWLWGDDGMVMGHPDENQRESEIASMRFAVCEDYQDRDGGKVVFDAFMFYRDVFNGEKEFNVYDVCEVQNTVVNKAEKVGRNSLCPCGSKKKYKKCCGR